jgi:uncharacterized damage-inducible protein DinB
MKRWLALAVAFLAVLPAFAQEKNPVTSVVREILPRQQKNLVAAVEEMPGDKYSFRPTAEQMSFAKLVLHITESNHYLCAIIGGAAPPKASELKETDSKDKLVARLKGSFDFCNAALEKMDDSRLSEKVQAFGGREAPMAWALIALTNDWADHYGAAAIYLRLNKLLPPTAQKK